MTEAQKIQALEQRVAQLEEALHKAAVILNTQKSRLGTVGLSVLALAEELGQK